MPKGGVTRMRIPDRAGASPVDQQLVEAVLDACNAVAGIALRSLADIDNPITLAQYRTLVVLCDDGPQLIGALASVLGVDVSSVSRMTDRLVSKGLARRDRLRADRRSIKVTVTGEGQAVVRAGRALRKQRIQAIVETIGPHNCRAIVGFLGRLDDHAGDVAPTAWMWGW